MMDQLKQQIQVVRGLREVVAKAKATRLAAFEEWKSSHQDIFSQEHNLGELLTNAEADLRSLTLTIFEETGNKAPAKGVSVKLYQHLEYNQAEAKSWCMEHRVALKLDTASFEKLAQVEKLSFVTISEEPRAQIATDLDKVLAVGKGE